MTKLLVLYYSMYGHIETMANTVAEGVRAEGCQADIKQVPETIPEAIAREAGAKFDQPAPVAKPDDLVGYDGILFGTPTRFGNMSGQMRNFLDQTSQLWLEGRFIGKAGSVFTSTATGGGNETTITSFWHTLAHLGFVIVGLPYAIDEIKDISEPRGGGPYGAGTLVDIDGSRQPSEKERAQAHYQGRHVAYIAKKLAV